MIDLSKRIELESKIDTICNINIKRKILTKIDNIDNKILNANKKELAGKRATNTYMFGDFNQFGIYGTHTRFEDLHFFCVNIEEKDENNLPLIICQFNDLVEVLEYLNKIKQQVA